MSELSFTNLAQMFFVSADRHPDKVMLRYKKHGIYLKLTYKKCKDIVLALAHHLKNEGLVQGDRLAILSENRPEWLFIDMACQAIGVVTVPIYTTLAWQEIAYILRDSKAKMIAVSGKDSYEKICSCLHQEICAQKVIAFDTVLSLDAGLCPVGFQLIEEWIQTVGHNPDNAVEEQAHRFNDLATIIYTSGTTGFPKGTMLTHSNFLANVSYCHRALAMSSRDTHLSFLPLSHVFERMAGHYLMMSIGATIAYAQSIDSVSADIRHIKPTFLLGVPRFYEKVKEKLEQASKGRSLKARITARALTSAQGRSIISVIAKILFKRSFRRAMGGRLRFCISGGAPLSLDTALFFDSLGLKILEGYGLTETSPVISVNRPNRYRYGSVGPVLSPVEVKICEDGEIATKSDCVMRGYWNKPDETDACLKEGWFHTGDLGKIDEHGFLHITGRKKELIVTSGGKKVSSRMVEELIEQDPAILRCVLFGEGKKYLTALIVPEMEQLLIIAKANKIAHDDVDDLMLNPATYRLMDERIQKRQESLAPYEQIKYFILIKQDFSLEKGELTPTMKIKRDVVIEKYRKQLLSLYDPKDV